jgi:hypothetical protein
MDKGNEEMKQDLQEVDARTLVTALTRQLNLAEHESSGLTDTSAGLSHATNDDTVLPVREHSNTSTRASDFVSARPNDTFIYHDDDGGEPPLPEFLARSHIQMALHQAEALHTQRQLLDGSLSHVSPTFAARPASLREGGGRGSLVVPEPHSRFGSLGRLPTTYVPNSPTYLLPSELAATSSSVPDKFAPGKESESVLKITKRPKLRPKDISHRRSLDGDDLIGNLTVDALNGNPTVASFPRLQGGHETSAPYFSPGFSPHHLPPQVRPSTSEWERPLMVTLSMGNQRLVVPGSHLMTVDDLQRIVRPHIGLAPSSFHLVSGETFLCPGTLLGDYPTHIGHFGMHVAVRIVDHLRSGEVSQRTPSLTTERLAVLPSTGGPFESPLGSATYTPPTVPRETSYLILLVFEDGSTLTQVVWPSMFIRQLCARIGDASSVPPDTVFCYFAGAVLDVERRIVDPPAIREGARVHVFFSIGKALECVVHAMQGRGPPPPTTPPPTPPAPQPFGPTLPPGFVRSPVTMPTTTSAPGTTGYGNHAKGTTTDRLRNSFKCPKFLGDTRHWKVWNQGFIRFLSINQLDYVIEEDFPQTLLSASQKEDNKLVYYILEDAVSGSHIASKYVRRAAVWNGHEAYFLLYDGYALSGPATAAIYLGELSHFRFKTDETPSEVVLRLQELFEDLEAIPGSAAMSFNDTQKINYLLSAICPERSLASVFSQIQTAQVRGTITFGQACDDLRYRCEALRADDLLSAANQPVKVRGMIAAASSPPANLNDPIALISTADKRQNRGASSKRDATPCLVQGCDTPTVGNLRLCKRCYHECVAGKTPSLQLKTGDKATFDTASNRVVFPTDKDTKTKGPRSIVKAAVAFAPTTTFN